jgi:hypothetical protein
LHNVENLEIDASSLYLLASPSTPEPARTEVLDLAAQGYVSRDRDFQASAAWPESFVPLFFP